MQISKISKPVNKNIVNRKRLFDLLDELLEKSVVWLSAPAGSGKTVLVSSYIDDIKKNYIWYDCDIRDNDLATFFHYMIIASKNASPRYKKALPPLTPEYMFDLKTYTLNFFEEFFRRLKHPFLIVFDNFEKIPPNSEIHQLLDVALSILPDNVKAIIISRHSPPAIFSRMIANSKITILEKNRINFKFEETKKLVKSTSEKGISETVLRNIQHVTNGWIAGIILFMERVKSVETETFCDFSSEEHISNYFEEEIFCHLPKKTQNFLLKTAFLSKITPTGAGKLTDFSDAHKILNYLYINNFFITILPGKGKVYNYHNLFKDFLKRKAEETCSESALHDLMFKSANLLKEEGYLDDAADILTQINDWQNLTSLILINANELITQGRFKYLGELIESIPKKIINKNSWLLFWFSVSKMPFNLPEAKKHFEQAFKLFSDQKDIAGSLLSWASIVECITFETLNIWQFDKWITRFYELIGDKKDLPPGPIGEKAVSGIITALTMRTPWHKDFSFWEKKGLEVVDNSPDMNIRIQILFQLGYYHLFTGDYLKVEHFIDTMRSILKNENVNDMSVIKTCHFETMCCLFKGDYDLCETSAKECLEFSRKTGVHFFDMMVIGYFALREVNVGNLKAASEKINILKQHSEKLPPLTKSLYHIVRTDYYIQTREYKKASYHAKISLKIVEDIGTPAGEALISITTAFALFLDKDYKLMNLVLKKSKKNIERLNSHSLNYTYHLIHSYIHFQLNNLKFGLDYLKTALTIGEKQDYLKPLFWNPKMMAYLCDVALNEDIEVYYIKKIIKKRCLLPLNSKKCSEKWPFEFKIYTLGRFFIKRSEKEIQFTGKTPKKAIALLKILISYGGKDVPVEKISDAIWPDTDGDQSKKNFTITLHRLRKFLGNDSVIKFSSGKISLNQDCCWIDIRSLKNSLSELAEKTNQKNLPEAVKHCKKVFNIYKGDFMASEESFSYIEPFRERLKTLVVKNTSLLAKQFKSHTDIEISVEIYNRLLHMENTSEEIYYNLMKCYKILDKKSEAVKIYNKCVKSLKKNLDIKPSQKLNSLYENLH